MSDGLNCEVVNKKEYAVLKPNSKNEQIYTVLSFE